MEIVETAKVPQEWLMLSYRRALQVPTRIGYCLLDGANVLAICPDYETGVRIKEALETDRKGAGNGI